ncbi:MAG: FtsX-like permease family protein [Candidatus Krumholzibacteria bacterium]|nr:FtsX-like permease family protein [Candidatus Krumholzibacteria bacterium]MDH4336993.1 FtsX-like permease family protein [Candidatus Krumholzibacteria bacterium]MDH5270692.1 FtsX-like permease family protein [Candidatus Krumholzibacteria bacterium]MDH5627635.1 FtsX-like permease family protein [Candidatus Krumholzibacteria bacterium]
MMMMRIALRNVLRHRLRTTFSVAALAIAVALLADMLMLSTGMEKTFNRVLSSVGYEVRVCPRGTLPFATEAVITESARVTDRLARDARVARVLRVLGTTLYADSVPVFAMGASGEDQSLYRVVEGVDISRVPVPEQTPLVMNRNAAAALGAGVGDTLSLTATPPGATMAFSDGAIVVVSGIIDIAFDLPGQRTVVMPLDAVQRLRPESRDAVSFVLVKLHAGGDDPLAPAGVDDQRAVAAGIEADFPELSAYSMDTLMLALERQLAYFKQFATILSTISLFITFLLIAVLLAIGVGERRGEIAALRSMGFARRSIQWMIVAESVVLLAMGAAIGAVLGWFLAGYLDGILTRSPSLPDGYRFFIPAPREIILAVLISGAAGVVAALLPAVQAARVDIPRTLHEEVV